MHLLFLPQFTVDISVIDDESPDGQGDIGRFTNGMHGVCRV